MRKYHLKIPSRPEIKFANETRELVSDLERQDRLAQWLMDEGSVTVAYFAQSNDTVLVVCGSMNDYAVLSKISEILGSPITSSGVPSTQSLPGGAVRVEGARAYALLQVVLPRLLGLKKSEAEAALAFFPNTGRMKGRHTTDEFFLLLWKQYAIDTLRQWNSRRRAKRSDDELQDLAKTWVEGRIRRARRFLRNQPTTKAT